MYSDNKLCELIENYLKDFPDPGIARKYIKNNFYTIDTIFQYAP